MSITSGLSVEYSIDAANYIIKTTGVTDWVPLTLTIPSGEDIDYWNDTVYAVADAIVAAGGTISAITRPLTLPEFQEGSSYDNDVRLANLTYPKP